MKLIQIDRRQEQIDIFDCKKSKRKNFCTETSKTTSRINPLKSFTIHLLQSPPRKKGDKYICWFWIFWLLYSQKEHLMKKCLKRRIFSTNYPQLFFCLCLKNCRDNRSGKSKHFFHGKHFLHCTNCITMVFTVFFSSGKLYVNWISDISMLTLLLTPLKSTFQFKTNRISLYSFSFTYHN